MSRRLVIDASIALAWSLAEETNEDADRALTIVVQEGALVPTLWIYEVANAVGHLVRRARLDATGAAMIVAALDKLRITAVPPDAPGWYEESNALAFKHALTLYDASYLHLAVVSRSKLVTADKKLQAAARSEGVIF